MPRFEKSIGPFQQTVVPNGTIAGTGLPLVLISHSTAGSEASHYDTALALADEGFVAAALTHTGDNYMDQSYVGNRRGSDANCSTMLLLERTRTGKQAKDSWALSRKEN
jgi:predicted dienelactone hydrolase